MIGPTICLLLAISCFCLLLSTSVSSSIVPVTFVYTIYCGAFYVKYPNRYSSYHTGCWYASAKPRSLLSCGKYTRFCVFRKSLHCTTVCIFIYVLPHSLTRGNEKTPRMYHTCDSSKVQRRIQRGLLPFLPLLEISQTAATQQCPDTQRLIRVLADSRSI